MILFAQIIPFLIFQAKYSEQNDFESFTQNLAPLSPFILPTQHCLQNKATSKIARILPYTFEVSKRINLSLPVFPCCSPADLFFSTAQPTSEEGTNRKFFGDKYRWPKVWHCGFRYRAQPFYPHFGGLLTATIRFVPGLKRATGFGRGEATFEKWFPGKTH